MEDTRTKLMNDLTVDKIRMWVEEHFEDNQYVGLRRNPNSCLVANYLKDRGFYEVEVTPIVISGDNVAVETPKDIRELIIAFDRSSRRDVVRAKARTVKRLISHMFGKKQVEVVEEKSEELVPV